MSRPPIHIHRISGFLNTSIVASSPPTARGVRAGDREVDVVGQPGPDARRADRLPHLEVRRDRRAVRPARRRGGRSRCTHARCGRRARRRPRPVRTCGRPIGDLLAGPEARARSTRCRRSTSTSATATMITPRCTTMPPLARPTSPATPGGGSPARSGALPRRRRTRPARTRPAAPSRRRRATTATASAPAPHHAGQNRRVRRSSSDGLAPRAGPGRPPSGTAATMPIGIDRLLK